MRIIIILWSWYPQIPNYIFQHGTLDNGGKRPIRCAEEKDYGKDQYRI